MKALHTIAFILVIVGGLNWLLVGLGVGPAGAGVVAYLPDVVAKIVYILVGLSALYLAVTHKGSCKNCVSDSSAPTQM
jgi:uncharacterized membrane protein YuzA (DUF378 family)